MNLVHEAKKSQKLNFEIELLADADNSCQAGMFFAVSGISDQKDRILKFKIKNLGSSDTQKKLLQYGHKPVYL